MDVVCTQLLLPFRVLPLQIKLKEKCTKVCFFLLSSYFHEAAAVVALDKRLEAALHCALSEVFASSRETSLPPAAQWTD